MSEHKIMHLVKPITLPTAKMAKYLGISKDFLLRHQGSLFLEGEHYFKPLGLNKFLWNVKKMEEWAFGKRKNIV